MIPILYKMLLKLTFKLVAITRVKSQLQAEGSDPLK